MEKAFAYVKEHPAQIALIVGAVILFYVIYTYLSGGSSASATTAGPDPNAQLAASTQLGLANLQVQAANDQFSAQLAATENNNSTAYAIAQLQANNQSQAISTSGQVQLVGIEAQKEVQIAGLTTQQQIAQIEASVSNNQTAANEAVAIATAATYQQIATINGQTQLGITQAIETAQTAQVQAITSAQTAQTQAIVSGQKHASDNSLFGNIFGGVLGAVGAIFSDAELKTDIVRIGTAPNGVGVYRYRYVGSRIYYEGPLAQDVERIVPRAVSRESGARKVNLRRAGVPLRVSKWN